MPVHVRSSHTLCGKDRQLNKHLQWCLTHNSSPKNYTHIWEVKGSDLNSTADCLSVCLQVVTSVPPCKCCYPFLQHSNILSMANNLCSWYITVNDYSDQAEGVTARQSVSDSQQMQRMPPLPKSSGAQPTSYCIGTDGSFLERSRVQLAEMWRQLHTSIHCQS